MALCHIFVPTCVPCFGAKTPCWGHSVMLLWVTSARSSQESPQCLHPILLDRGGWAGRGRAQCFHQPVPLGCGGSQILLLLLWHLSAPSLLPGTRGQGGGLNLPMPCSPGSMGDHCFRQGWHWCPWVLRPPWARTGRACPACTARPTCPAPGPGEAVLGSGCGMHPEPLKERGIPLEYIF